MDAQGSVNVASAPASRRHWIYQRLSPYLFLLPVTVVLVGILLGPTIFAGFVSFATYDMFGGTMKYAGLQNYSKIAADPEFFQSLGNTLVYTLLTVGVEFLFGLGIALLLNRELPGMGVIRALVIAPWILSDVIAGLDWRMMLQDNYGVVNYLLGVLWAPAGSTPWLSAPGWAMVSVVLADVWHNTPFVALLLLAGLQAIPQEPFEAARIDGASSWRTFRHVTVPLLSPAIFAVVLFRTMFAFREFTVPWTITSGGPSNSTELLSIYLYKQMLTFFNFGTASAVSVVMLALTILATLAFLRGLFREL
ncbi:MAG: sugar ABC transporter permease [Chloroflexi bacterium]|nr:sugar ABC transporter permease [Chloroflexota bacterium]